ncbi:AAA family ATPase [Corynebacterium stationis]|uniref:AAA family ATPase n=1 Tax=Corynebacterium stationis TaxID=1705 RepID=UPI0026129ADC|nr:AAA family ATPase [Corynebacterium stationis]
MNEVIIYARNVGESPISKEGVFTLVHDNWDDYRFRTSFVLYYADKYQVINLGTVKIATKGMRTNEGGTSYITVKTDLPREFHYLGEQYFSLGQDAEYYEQLLKLPDNKGRMVLEALRDVSAAPKIFDSVSDEEVFKTSLLRFVPINTVTTQFRRIASGGQTLISYGFKFKRSQQIDSAPPLELSFEVDPEAMPPENVHALIGPNGTGKSTLLKDFFRVAVEGDDSVGEFKHLDALEQTDYGFPFADVLHISFSAFDEELRFDTSLSDSINGQVVGLSTNKQTLEAQFLDSIQACSSDSRIDRWIQSMKSLSQGDPLLSKILDKVEPGSDFEHAREAFTNMSSGHKIVTLTVTRLVELVKEKTLILIDEPELHLHPPLLSALTRVISEISANRNGVAIIATHSPVVLQEIPSNCVWTLQRYGSISKASRVPIETFGESVSRLTAEVFKLSIDKTGFRKILNDLLTNKNGSAQRALDALGGQLGAEGRYLLSSLEIQAKNRDV